MRIDSIQNNLMYQQQNKLSDLKHNDENKNVSEKENNKHSEKYTCNTDRVDREIEKLKEKKRYLEQQINSSPKDDKKLKELKKELANIENKLKQTDNDTYRKQHSSISKLV